MISRIHRLEGQLRAAERLIEGDDYLLGLGQLEAISAASRSLLASYISALLESNLAEDEKRSLVTRTITKNL